MKIIWRHVRLLLQAWERVFAQSSVSWSLMVSRVMQGNLGTPELTAGFWFEHSSGGTSRFHPGESLICPLQQSLMS